CKLILNHYKYKFGICIPCQTDIGKGFYIGHFGGIVVSPESKIGEHCNISQGVTIGKISQGEKKGAPTIGNRVYIGPGAKIVGNITIGDNVAIGANAVVVNDVLSDCTIGGIPAKIISTNNSSLYINNTSN
ncbi:serine O-acetyltransferase, partial [Aliivibrio kagoshimensis]|uniref:serine O-acetyltransferase n=1 Tax=Aliivibrio kagoshimensis TaxID=2910230 RepID=UPI003D0E29B2